MATKSQLTATLENVRQAHASDVRAALIAGVLTGGAVASAVFVVLSAVIGWPQS